VEMSEGEEKTVTQNKMLGEKRRILTKNRDGCLSAVSVEDGSIFIYFNFTK
jgi:hypothetical protein